MFDRGFTSHAYRAFLLATLVAALMPANCALAFPQRPFVLVNSNELADLRSELSKPGWKTQLYHSNRAPDEFLGSGRGIRSNADLWLKRNIEIPIRGGHYHLFFCDDGERLELPKDQRFVRGPYRCPKCGRKYSGERYEGALRCVVHHQLAVAARDLALVARLENKREYADKAAEILLKYAAVYPGPHTSNVEGGILLQSLNEAMWIIPLAQAYDLIYEDLRPEQREMISRFLQVAANGIRVCGVKGNWGSWHLSAVGVVGYATENEEMIAWATTEFKRQIRDELGDDGLWPESVHCYHYFPLAAFVDFAEAAMHTGTDLYHWEAKPGKSLLAMFKAPLQYAYPDLRLPAINDGWFQAFVPGDFYEVGWKREKDPQFEWVLANAYRPEIHPATSLSDSARAIARGGLYAFVFGQKLPVESHSPNFKSVNFPVLGICTLRSTNRAMMTFDYGPFLGHGHRDKMGVTLWANNQLWAADYGTPGYGAAILPWYQGTLSHNTIVVDGKNQQPTHENEAALWLGDADFEAAQSTTRQAYPGVSYTRTVIRAGDCFVIADKLVSETTHIYDFYFHSEGRLSISGGRSPAKSSAAPVSWITDVSAGKAGREIVGSWNLGEKGLAFWIEGDSDLTALTAKCPAETGARKVPLLIARQSGRSAEFIAVLVPGGRKPDLKVQREGRRLLIQQGFTKHTITIPEDGSRPFGK